jgi:hypothetical protein
MSAAQREPETAAVRAAEGAGRRTRTNVQGLSRPSRGRTWKAFVALGDQVVSTGSWLSEFCASTPPQRLALRVARGALSLPAAGAFRSSCGRRNVEAGRVLILDEAFGLGVT